ncbi:MAG TPA: sigma-70 family RNA polymerase sigma factor [Mycobacterium sp.]
MPVVAGVAADSATPEDTLMKALYHEHAAALWRYALRLTGNRNSAEDVVQETLLRAWQHPEVSPSTARAWLFTVARHLIIDQSRSARAHHEVRPLDDAPERAGPDETDAALDRMLISEAITRLSADHRAVICRSYYQGWSTAQIAADLGIVEGTVKSRLHYAVRALRLALQELGVTR